MNLERRVTVLERQNRLLVAAIVVTSGLAVFLAAAAPLNDIDARSVRAKAFLLVGDDGNVRGMISIDATGEAKVSVCSPDGKHWSAIVARQDVAGLNVLSGNDSVTAYAGTTTGLQVKREERKIFLNPMNNIPVITVSDGSPTIHEWPSIDDIAVKGAPGNPPEKPRPSGTPRRPSKFKKAQDPGGPGSPQREE